MQIGFQPSSSPFRGSSVFRLCMRCTAHAVKSLEKFLLMTLLVLAFFLYKVMYYTCNDSKTTSYVLFSGILLDVRCTAENVAHQN